MLVSMLVRFFLRRFKPSIPCPGEFRALGLERAESDERFSVGKQRKVVGGAERAPHACNTHTNTTAKLTQPFQTAGKCAKALTTCEKTQLPQAPSATLAGSCRPRKQGRPFLLCDSAQPLLSSVLLFWFCLLAYLFICSRDQRKLVGNY